MKKNIILVLGILFACGFGFIVINIYPFLSKMNEFKVQEYDNNLTLVFGSGGNSCILIGDKQILIIDPKMFGGAEKFYELVEAKTKGKEIIIVNTHLHGDHAGGNKLYKNAKILAGAYSREAWIEENGKEGLPNDWIKDTKELKIGDEVVIIKNLGQAHTMNDVVVYFKNRKMLFMGDLVMIGFHPFFKKKDGSIIEMYYEKQNLALDEFKPEKIIPGHGPIGGVELIKEFQTYLDEMKLVALGSLDKSIVKEKYKDWPSLFHMSGVDPSILYWKDELQKK